MQSTFNEKTAQADFKELLSATKAMTFKLATLFWLILLTLTVNHASAQEEGTAIMPAYAYVGIESTCTQAAPSRLPACRYRYFVFC